MTRLILSALIGAIGISQAAARLGQNSTELEAEYGRRLKRVNDVESPFSESGRAKRSTYEFKNYRVQVRTFDGVSVEETYSHKDASPLPAAEIQTLLTANSSGMTWRNNKNGRWLLGTPPFVGTAVYMESESPPYLVVMTLMESGQRGQLPVTGERTFTGVANVKDQETNKWAVIHSGETVIELPLSLPGQGKFIPVTAGKTYSVTVNDERPENMGTQIAAISDCEHRNWHETVYDASLQTLVRINEGKTVIYDRSVCELHHVKMELRNVEMTYGMESLTECDAHFPHFREFASGGCMVGETKICPIYVCPECVAACAKYKQEHPDAR